MKRSFIGLTGLLLAAALLTGCAGAAAEANVVLPTIPPTRTPYQPDPVPPTAVPTYTPVPSPTVTPTPVILVQGPGEVICPILLYHHIDVPPANGNGLYYTSPAVFRQQMQALYDLGYRTISIDLLITAITRGAALPERPLIISFDDGDLDVYTNAFPIMHQFGFTGVLYLVSNYLDRGGHLSVAQVQEMAAAGWEVGSHSMSHADLTVSHGAIYEEGLLARRDLEERLGLPATTFAYPYGRRDDYVVDYIRAYGYLAAVGLGGGWAHTPDELLYLSRRPVDGGIDLPTFLSYLPWRE